MHGQLRPPPPPCPRPGGAKADSRGWSEVRARTPRSPNQQRIIAARPGGAGETPVRKRVPSSPPNNTSVLHPPRPFGNPSPLALLPASGAREDVFSLHPLETKQTSFALNQPPFALPSRASKNALPLPQELGDEAQVRGWSQHAEPRSQKGALFPQTTPLSSTPETIRQPPHPWPCSPQAGRGRMSFSLRPLETKQPPLALLSRASKNAFPLPACGVAKPRSERPR